MQRAIRSTRVYFRGLTFVLIVVSTFASRAASAQEPFIGEIRWVGFNFAPKGWALCDGQILSIAQNTALFSLLGTTYGGNGQTTFALPDMRGRVPLHPGTGPGLTPRILGEAGGQESVTLTTAELPSHAHALTSHTHSIPSLSVDVKASSGLATTTSPVGSVLATATLGAGGGGPKKSRVTDIYNAGPADVSLAAGAATAPGTTGGGSGTTMATGGGGPHENMQPFLGLTCIIALEGIYPSRP